jgi:hypothetical protein
MSELKKALVLSGGSIKGAFEAGAVKAIVEKVADFQKDELIDLSRIVNSYLNITPLKEELNLIHKRLDVQLTKIAKNEEAILIVGSRD